MDETAGGTVHEGTNRLFLMEWMEEDMEGSTKQAKKQSKAKNQMHTHKTLYN